VIGSLVSRRVVLGLSVSALLVAAGCVGGAQASGASDAPGIVEAAARPEGAGASSGISFAATCSKDRVHETQRGRWGGRKRRLE
jgi:hypothetical protein